MIFKEVKWTPEITKNAFKAKVTHEEIPQEDLWEDGELNLRDVEQKVLLHTLDLGDWILVRRIDGKD
tara:strand:+ start:527 stop:727 length:201 start_codon:yes stop_codon:yes gene_type:complete